MKRKEMELKFLDYLEGELSPAETAELEAALATDPELKSSLAAYQELMVLERLLAAEQRQASPALAVQVMSEVEKVPLGFFRRWQMKYQEIWRCSGRILGTAAVGVLVFILVQHVPEEEYRLKTSVTEAPSADQGQSDSSAAVEALPLSEPANETGKAKQAAESKEAPLQQLPNSPGTSAITVPIEATSGIEGWARPGSRVDVVVTEEKEGELRTRVIARDLRTLSSGGQETTLEATKDEAEVLDAARKKGKVSLMMSASSDAKVGGLKEGGLYELGAEEVQAPQYYRRPSDAMQIVAPYPWAPNTERYGSYEENPRIYTRDEAVSTFSIDVDTGSYTNARRFLSQGKLPPSDSIRIEEFINYFTYDYPVQSEKPFAVYYEAAPTPLGDGRYLLKLGIKARDLSEQSAPWNLVFLVDTSGSMQSEDKLELVKRALRVLVGQMRSQDRISIVTYAGSAGLQLEAAKLQDKSGILQVIDRLAAGGSTYGSGGINLAYEVAVRNRIANGVNRVILATDGDFNVGVTSLADLLRLIEQQRGSGVSLTTLGFGEGNYKEETMEQLANKGNGNYFYIDSFKEARKVFETDLLGTIETVAKDVKLQIEFNPAHVQQYRLIGYDNRKLRNEDFNNDQIDAGEIGSGHTVTALYELVLNGSPLADKDQVSRYQADTAATPAPLQHPHELAFLKIRYKDPQGSQSKLLEYPIKKTDVRSSVQQASSDFRFAAAVVGFGQLLRQSKYLGSYGYSEVIALAEKELGQDSFGYRREFLELVRNARSIAGAAASPETPYYRESSGRRYSPTPTGEPGEEPR